MSPGVPPVSLNVPTGIFEFKLLVEPSRLSRCVVSGRKVNPVGAWGSYVKVRDAEPVFPARSVSLAVIVWVVGERDGGV